VGQQVGLIVIDPSRRRRYRVNGWLDATQLLPGGAALLIEADQAYGNCPQFIQQRELAPVENPAGEGVSEVHRAVSGDSLSAADRAQVQAADTFFLGTAHPERGTDASHRGGPAGFVRVTDEQHLWWPDYAGNNMFNSLGNLASDPSAALLFVDFSTGATLHLSGRRISFALEAAVPGARMALRAANTAGYPRNPVLTDR
jgi:predicted pyridoxine 5'-phosphate oxidase superfamily flavin-nucleotide-binding protein